MFRGGGWLENFVVIAGDISGGWYDCYCTYVENLKIYHFLEFYVFVISTYFIFGAAINYTNNEYITTESK